MNNLKERLDDLRLKIQSEEFLAGKGLSNEVNIRIFCYDVEEEMVVQHFIQQLKEDRNLGCNLVDCNLYQVFLKACDELDITDEIPNIEEEDGREYLLGELREAVGPNELIEQIQYEPHQYGDVLMLTGVGDAFPFVRVHALLEALQPYFSDIPILVMYPGRFDGYYLKLFDRLKPNDYYRAFNLI